MRAPDSHLLLPYHEVDHGVMGGLSSYHVGGAVGTGVIDEEDADGLITDGPYSPEEGGYVVPFVVGGDYQADLHCLRQDRHLPEELSGGCDERIADSLHFGFAETRMDREGDDVSGRVFRDPKCLPSITKLLVKGGLVHGHLEVDSSPDPGRVHRLQHIVPVLL